MKTLHKKLTTQTKFHHNFVMSENYSLSEKFELELKVFASLLLQQRRFGKEYPTFFWWK